MTEYVPFSRRYGYRSIRKELLEQEVPESARIGLYYIIDDQLDFAHLKELYSYVCKFLRIEPLDASRKLLIAKMYNALNPEKEFIKNIIMECDWVHFYDLCELIFAFMKSGYQEDFSTQVNNLFKEEQLGYEMLDGKIEKIGNPITDAKTKEARYLLKEPEFKGADELFEKAIKALNERPNPDKENCIKDAVATIESVVKIIVGDDKASLDDIIKNAVRNGVIPQPLDQTITKLHAYRGNEPAVAHGGKEPSKVTVDEAEFVLAMSAAMIIYLVKKRSRLS